MTAFVLLALSSFKLLDFLMLIVSKNYMFFGGKDVEQIG